MLNMFFHFIRKSYVSENIVVGYEINLRVTILIL